MRIDRYVLLLFIILIVAEGTCADEKNSGPLFPLIAGSYWKYINFGKSSDGGETIGLTIHYLFAPVEDYRSFLKRKTPTVFFKFLNYCNTGENKGYPPDKANSKALSKILWQKSLEITKDKLIFYDMEMLPVLPLYFPYSKDLLLSPKPYPSLWRNFFDEYLLYQNDGKILKFLNIGLKVLKVKDNKTFWSILEKEVQERSFLFLPLKSEGREGWIQYYTRNGESPYYIDIFTLRILKKTVYGVIYLLREEEYTVKEKRKLKLTSIKGLSIEGELTTVVEKELLPDIGIIKMREVYSPDKKGGEVDSYLLEYYNPKRDYTWEIREDGLEEVRKRIRNALRKDLEKKIKDAEERDREIEKKASKIEEKMKKDFFELWYEWEKVQDNM